MAYFPIYQSLDPEVMTINIKSFTHQGSNL